MKREVTALFGFVFSLSSALAQTDIDRVTNNLNALSIQIYIIGGAILVLAIIAIFATLYYKKKMKNKNEQEEQEIVEKKATLERETSSMEYSTPTNPNI